MVVVLLAFALSGCGRNGGANQQVVVTGSTTVLPIAEVAGEMYVERTEDVDVLVSGMGSSAGIESVSKGSSDIGTSSRELKEAEQALGLVDTPVAFDAIAVIVNHDNPVQELTSDQVRRIFAGEITNWSEVGGPDWPIGLVNRDEASGTREAFSKIIMGDTDFYKGAVVLPGTGQVRAVVSEVEYAVGYISLGFVNEDVRAVAIDGVEASEASVVRGTYKIQRILHFFTMGQPSPASKDYMDYVLSPEIQDSVVRDAGFIPITAKEALGG